MKYLQLFKIGILGLEFSFEWSFRGPYTGFMKMGTGRWSLSVWNFIFRFEYYGPGIW